MQEYKRNEEELYGTLKEQESDLGDTLRLMIKKYDKSEKIYGKVRNDYSKPKKELTRRLAVKTPFSIKDLITAREWILNDQFIFEKINPKTVISCLKLCCKIASQEGVSLLIYLTNITTLKRNRDEHIEQDFRKHRPIS